VEESVIAPIDKKGSNADGSKYQGMSLLLTSCKIVSNILLSRLSPHVDKIIRDHLCGFQHNR
jgi:hypothetical protein